LRFNFLLKIKVQYSLGADFPVLRELSFSSITNQPGLPQFLFLQIVAPLQGNSGERQDEMKDMDQFRSFRILAAVGVAILYVFLAATGNA
jgi:hypothetical protein